MVKTSDLAGVLALSPGLSWGRGRCWALGVCAMALFASGCVTVDQAGQGADGASAPGDQVTDILSSQYVLSGAYVADWQPALRSQTALGTLALRANDLAIERSPTVFDLRAAEAESAAERAAWFPRIRPVATAGLGGVSSGVGLSVTQLIHDFGQTRNRREKAEILRVLTELEFWAERNDDVLEALNSYVDAVEANEILLVRGALEDRLAELASREEQRLAAGVVAQGDALFIDVTRQENRRETIRARAELAEAQQKLQQDTGVLADGQVGLRFPAVAGACTPPGRRDYAPELLRARMAVELTELEQQEARRALFPRVAAEASILSTDGSAPTETGRIALDGGSLAGGGGRLRAEAAELRVSAAERELRNTSAELARELDRLTAERRLFERQRSDYEDLIRTNERSLELFQDRFAAGAASTSEAVRIEAERTANRIAVLETNALLARNCLNTARLFGALADAELGEP